MSAESHELWSGAIAFILAGLALWGWRLWQKRQARQAEQAARHQRLALDREHAQFAAAWMLEVETGGRLDRNWRDIDCEAPDQDGNILWQLRAGLHEKPLVANGYFQPRFGYICLRGYRDETTGRWMETPNCTRTYAHHTPVATAAAVFAAVLNDLGLPSTPGSVEIGCEKEMAGLACFRMKPGDEDSQEEVRLGFGFVQGSATEGIVRVSLAFKPDGTKVVGIGATAAARKYRYWHDRNGRLHLKPLPQA